MGIPVTSGLKPFDGLPSIPPPVVPPPDYSKANLNLRPDYFTPAPTAMASRAPAAPREPLPPRLISTTINAKGYVQVKNGLDMRPMAGIYRAFLGELVWSSEMNWERLREIGLHLRQLRLEDINHERLTGQKTVRVFAFQELYDPSFLNYIKLVSGYEHSVYGTNVITKQSKNDPSLVGGTSDLALIASEPIYSAQFHPVTIGTNVEQCVMNAGPNYRFGLLTCVLKVDTGGGNTAAILAANQHPPPRFPYESGFRDYIAEQSIRRVPIHEQLIDRLLAAEAALQKKLKPDQPLIVSHMGDFNCVAGSEIECERAEHLPGFTTSDSFFEGRLSYKDPGITSYDGRNKNVEETCPSSDNPNNTDKCTYGTLDHVHLKGCIMTGAEIYTRDFKTTLLDHLPVSASCLLPQKALPHHAPDADTYANHLKNYSKDLLDLAVKLRQAPSSWTCLVAPGINGSNNATLAAILEGRSREAQITYAQLITPPKKAPAPILVQDERPDAMPKAIASPISTVTGSSQ